MKLSNKENSPFEILGVPLDADDDEVKVAYRRLAMRYHPDRNASNEAEDQFKRVQTAYQLIKTESSRIQVIELLQIYNVLGKKTQTNAAGNQAFDAPSYDFKPKSAYFVEFFLWLTISLRWERMPLKLIFFLPFTLLLYRFIHPLGLNFQNVVSAIWQSVTCAFFTDVILQYVKFTNRHQLRMKVDRFVLITLVSTLALMIITYFGEYQNPPLYIYGEDPEYMYAIALLISSIGIYAWIVFCFIFQRHDPTWETSMVYVGIASILYVSVFLL